MLEGLRLLEGFDLKKMGLLSPDYIHTVTEVMKLAMADRDEYYADPRFVKVPIKGLLSEEYTKIRRPLIDPHQASLELRPGDPYQMKAVKKGLRSSRPREEPLRLPWWTVGEYGGRYAQRAGQHGWSSWEHRHHSWAAD